MPPYGSSNLTITNPLVLYRSLIATKRIQPDPAQHRLALHLQKLYDQLIDYEPNVEYSDRLKQLSKTISSTDQNASISPSQENNRHHTRFGTRGLWTSLVAKKEQRDSLALTRVLTSHEAALELQSPKGLMLHGEVGTGKSMLIDLFADSLPTRKKRRWHFNTFMLETISRLEQLRKEMLRRSSSPSNEGIQEEYPLLHLSRSLITTSPILILDEFQLPDRAASKILSNLLTSFFQLGGVLIATSNRMPEELAKAAGMEFSLSRAPVGKWSRLGWRMGGGRVGRDDGPGQRGEFAQFLEVLRARCEVWEMEGRTDYRRMSGEADGQLVEEVESGTDEVVMNGADFPASKTTKTDRQSSSETKLPKHYHIISPSSSTSPSPPFLQSLHSLTSTSPSTPIPWTPTTLTVYNRPLTISHQHSGIALFTFASLCAAPLGPADYITLASTYHTICITAVPVLGFLQKNEARRFITLLDAMYEARCRLLIEAEAGPDGIFFPTVPNSPNRQADHLSNTDATHAETYSEIHQDLTSPFRPNVSSYTSPSPSSSSFLPSDALEDDPPNRIRRQYPDSSFTDERRPSHTPDFSNVGSLTGEDEKFAVKRAESRIWEMCSAKWWNQYTNTNMNTDTNTSSSSSSSSSTPLSDLSAPWWRPLPPESRHWERSSSSPDTRPRDVPIGLGGLNELRDEGKEGTTKLDLSEERQDELFAHGGSPFRADKDAPPKIQWTHVWGTVRWGKRAGAWGKGVEGLEERRREKEREREEEGEKEEGNKGA